MLQATTRALREENDGVFESTAYWIDADGGDGLDSHNWSTRAVGEEGGEGCGADDGGGKQEEGAVQERRKQSRDSEDSPRRFRNSAASPLGRLHLTLSIVLYHIFTSYKDPTPADYHYML